MHTPEDYRGLDTGYRAPLWLDAGYIKSIVQESEGAISPVVVYRVAGGLGALEVNSKLPTDIKSIFEFGSGAGAGLVALSQFAKHIGDTQIAGSEIDPIGRESSLSVAQKLGNVTGVEVDGFNDLENSKYDLVIANMFGPIYPDNPKAERFVTLASRAIEIGGAVVINSDRSTMGIVSKIAESKPGIDCELIHAAIMPFRIREARLPFIVMRHAGD